MPTEFTYNEFKEILDSNKIVCAKAECMKSRRDGRSLQMFQLELKDPAEAEALTSGNLKCPQAGLFSRWKSFELHIRSGSVITENI